jgi:hypothetical protein
MRFRSTSFCSVLVLRRIVIFSVLVTLSSCIADCGSTAPPDTTRATSATSVTSTTPVSATTRVSETSREPVATVGDRTITRGILQRWVALANHGRTAAPEPPDYTRCVEYLRSASTGSAHQTTAQLRGICGKRYEELWKPALSSLIHAQWLIGEAADEGLRIDARLKRESVLSGPHGEEVRFKLIAANFVHRLYRKLEQAVPPVNRAQLPEYYQRHKEDFVVPELRDLYIIRTADDAAAKQAKKEIEGGTSFATIVKNTSLIQPSGAHDGLLRGLGPDNWPEPPLSKEIFHAPLKTLSGPVQISLGSYVFEVLRRIPAHRKTLAEATPEVAEKLHLILRHRTFSPFVAAFRKKWLAKTNCRPGYVVKYCKQFKATTAELDEYPDIL